MGLQSPGDPLRNGIAWSPKLSSEGRQVGAFICPSLHPPVMVFLGSHPSNFLDAPRLWSRDKKAESHTGLIVEGSCQKTGICPSSHSWSQRWAVGGMAWNMPVSVQPPVRAWWMDRLRNEWERSLEDVVSGWAGCVQLPCCDEHGEREFLAVSSGLPARRPTVTSVEGHSLRQCRTIRRLTTV